MYRLLDALTPAFIRDLEYPEERSRARVAVVVMLLNISGTFVAWVASLFVNYVPGLPHWLLQMWFGTSTLAYAATIFLFRRTGNFALCGNLFAVNWYTMVLFSALLFPNPQIASIFLHFTVVPFYLALIASYRSAIFWLCVFMATPVVLNEVGVLHFGMTTVGNWLGNGFGVFVAIYLGHYYRELMSERLRKQCDLLEYAAAHDALTGIENRATFETRLDESVSLSQINGSKSTLVYIDLDGFKEVNDTYGHQAGDYVLRETAERLSRLTRETDIVARLGGDEFALILHDCDSRSAERLLERLSREIEKPIQVMGHRLQVGCSFGTAEYPTEGTDLTHLTHRADQRMYDIKRARSASVATSSG